MRPEILYSVFAPLTALKGVGPRIAAAIERIAGAHVLDLFWHLPTGLIDRRFAPKIADAPVGVICTMTVRIDAHHPPRNRRLPYKVACSDETGDLSLVFFHARADYLQKVLPEGEIRVVSGKVEQFGKQRQMSHPDHIGTLDELSRLQAVEPVYPLTQGLSLKVLSRAIAGALDRAPELGEWLDPEFFKRQEWMGWHDAVLAVHAPESDADLDPLSPARQRLAYDELLANQLALALVRLNMKRLPGRATVGDKAMRDKVQAALPFTFTGDQQRAIEEIVADMGSKDRMQRLLQGDVGSGKTVVALFAMLAAAEAGRQAALLAPTEILARQHFATLEPLAQAAGVELVLLTGRDKGKSRQAVLERLSSGGAALAVGTHALFQEGVEFKDLALAVVDEQHRFGVHQRLMIGAKGNTVDFLVMSATPIPRTLTLTAYGDMEVSRLAEKPAGRAPVDTRTIPLARIDQVVAAVERAMNDGAKVYWVCPLIEESETTDLAAAEDRYARLKQRFGGRVGLVHGRMKTAEKDAVMAGFADGDTGLLVATTVIEVGLDVPAATVMVIEHAERFGLAQLHQMRGRVGRAPGLASTCLLLYAPNPTSAARDRLKIMRETDDGFRIAEEDLRLRGAGELLGTRQSGLPEFRVADIAVHGDLLATARDDARLIIDKDAALGSERGQRLRVLLYLFERDNAVKLLRSG